MKVCPVCAREYPAGQACQADGASLVDLVTGTGGRMEDLVGTIVDGRYRIERVIGRGGMGTVFQCRHIVIGKIGAMKVLRSSIERAEGVLQRFVREAQAANAIASRHIAETSDFGQLPNGCFYVVMELLEGMDLTKALKEGRLDQRAILHVFRQIAETLELAHQRGIVHRDLKPDNVFLVRDADDPLFVKILDFGIAKIAHGEPSGGLTETGVILGTPYYMSPEQARGEVVDGRSDIYSLGIIMYRAFTGRLPFVGESTIGVLTRHLTEPPEPPSRIATIDPYVERVILRCLEKPRDARFQTMAELAQAIRAIELHYQGHAAPPVAQQAAPTRVDARPYGANPSGASPAVPHSGAHAAQAPYGSAPGGAQAPHAGYAPSGPHHPSGPHPASGAMLPAGGPYPTQSSGPHGLTGPQPPTGFSSPVGAATSGQLPAVGPAGPELTARAVAANVHAVPERKGAGATIALVLVGALVTSAAGAAIAIGALGKKEAVAAVTSSPPPPPAPASASPASPEPTDSAARRPQPATSAPPQPVVASASAVESVTAPSAPAAPSIATGGRPVPGKLEKKPDGKKPDGKKPGAVGEIRDPFAND